MTTLATVIGRGTLASRPTAGTPGSLYFATDAGVAGQLTRDNGSSWDVCEPATATPTAATTGAIGGVRIDKTPSSGDPIAITAAGMTPAGTAGAPTSGTYLTGELYLDSAYALYVCSAGGTPGTWHAVSGGGGGGGMSDPETTAGDMIYRNGSNVTSRLPVGSSGQFLGVTAGLPAYQALPDPTHSYFTHLAALLEPDAIEPNQINTFSYAIGSTVTKYLLLGWALQLAGAGRIDVRDPRQPLPLRGVTVTGSQAGSIAAFLDPTKPTYSDAWKTYHDRLLSIAQLPTQVVNLGAASTYYPLLPGPYGAIVTSVTCFNFAWVGLGSPSLTGVNWSIHPELGDTSSDYTRWEARMLVPVTKAIVCRAGSGVAGGVGSPFGSITYVQLPSTWSAVTDPLAPYAFRDDFMAATLDATTVWNRTQSTAGNVEISTAFPWLALTGNGTWGANGAYIRTGFARSSQQHLLVDVFVDLAASTSVIPNTVVGWFDGAGYSYSNAAHGIDFTNNAGGTALAMAAFENGTLRGYVGSGYTAGCVYRLRLTLQSGGGCTYEIQGGVEYPAIGGTSWTTITPGTTSSATNTLYPGVTQQTSGVTTSIGDVRVY